MSEIYCATGARKRDWEFLLATDRGLALKVEGLIFDTFPCTICREEMVLERRAAVEAAARGWVNVCLTCACRANLIPVPGR